MVCVHDYYREIASNVQLCSEKNETYRQLKCRKLRCGGFSKWVVCQSWFDSLFLDPEQVTMLGVDSQRECAVARGLICRDFHRLILLRLPRAQKLYNGKLFAYLILPQYPAIHDLLHLD